MSVQNVEVGFVSASPSLVEFLAEVFELHETSSVTVPIGTVVKLGGAGDTVLKVFVPVEAPKAGPRSGPFYSFDGLRFLTLRVDDLDATVERALARGGTVLSSPRDAGSGVRAAMLQDPDGNTYEVSAALAD